MKKRTLKSVATVIEKRTEKRKEQLQHLEAKRQSQWEDELLKCAVSALPRSTPKVIEEKMKEIRRQQPADAPAAEAALDAIGLLKENLNGAPSSVLDSDPFQMLWAETLLACSRQSSKWKLLPMTLVHPFTESISVMTAITGKKISRNDMGQMERVAKNIKERLDSVYKDVVNNDGEVTTERELLSKLRDRYPSVLVTRDDSAINSVLDSSTSIRRSAELPDWALGVGYIDTDGEPDGYVLDLEDIHTDLTTTDNNDDDEDDNAGEAAHGEGKVSEENRDVKDDIDNTIDNSIETLEALSIIGDNEPDNKELLPKPVATSNNDFTSSFSDSYIHSVVDSAKKDYHAMPPPPRQMGRYAAVPPMESSPKKEPGVPEAVQSRQDPKRNASPMHSEVQQPRKLIKVEPDQAELRQLRHQLEESNAKVASLGQCITDMQASLQRRQWMHEQRTMNQSGMLPYPGGHVDNIRDMVISNESRHLQHRQPQHRARHQRAINIHIRSRPPPIPNTPRPSRRRTQTVPNVHMGEISPIRRSLGPRTSAAERTRMLIGRESLGGRVPGPVIHESHRTISRRTYDRNKVE